MKFTELVGTAIANTQARFSLEGDSASALVFRSKGPARIEDFANATGDFAARMSKLGVRSRSERRSS